uniref:Uncharacterized protein n=1 Tax=Setaria italica TaxID=4555 RepID=K4ANZ3_SETIT
MQQLRILKQGEAPKSKAKANRHIYILNKLCVLTYMVI